MTLQALGNHGWRTLASTRTNANGRFRLRYMPHENTSELVRLRFAGDAEDRSAHRRLGRLDVYRLAEASWYGGGGELACGGELTSSTLGVANKTLPCGTRVTLRYDGRTVRGQGDRPRAVCRRAGIRFDRSDEAGARVRRRGRGVEHALSRLEPGPGAASRGRCGRPSAWERSCRGWLSVESRLESAECLRE